MLLKDKEEAKLSLSLLWWRTGGTELQLQSYQTSALDGIDWSTSCSGYFTPGKEPPHPLNWRVSVSRADVDIYTKILFKQTWNKLQTLQPSLTRDNRTRSQALFHYFRPNTFFFSQDVCFIFFAAAAEDYTTKSIRVRILQGSVTIRHCKTCLKKKETKILGLYYGSTLQCHSHAVYYVTHTHTLHVRILL